MLWDAEKAVCRGDLNISSYCRRYCQYFIPADGLVTIFIRGFSEVSSALIPQEGKQVEENSAGMF